MRCQLPRSHHIFFIYARLVGAVNRHAVINPEAVAGVEIVVTINRVHTLRGSSDLTELVPCTAMLLQRLGDPSDLSSPPLTPDNESPAVGNAQAAGAQAWALNRPRAQETPHQDQWRARCLPYQCRYQSSRLRPLTKRARPEIAIYELCA